jgi:hypothetical protein
MDTFKPNLKTHFFRFLPVYVVFSPCIRFIYLKFCTLILNHIYIYINLMFWRKQIMLSTVFITFKLVEKAIITSLKNDNLQFIYGASVIHI